MTDQIPTIEPKFWLHIPLQTIRGERLLMQTSEVRLSIFGHSACLREHHLPNFDPSATTGSIIVGQFLLFDPLPETEARGIFDEIWSRLPVLSLRLGLSFTVPSEKLDKSLSEHNGVFNGPLPTLIPAEFEPKPLWGDFAITSSTFATYVLGQLPSCRKVFDEKIKAAIDLSIASRYDSLPRSIFLAQLAIIDSLTSPRDRSPEIRGWLDDKIQEANSLGDAGLLSALGRLKKVSNATAVRDLVTRASLASGETESKIAERQKRADQLWRVRNDLAHGTKLEATDVEDARNLTKLVLNAAIEHPEILQG